MPPLYCSSFFFFNDTATTEIYTLSLHDALPITRGRRYRTAATCRCQAGAPRQGDRKSTRLNSSHSQISYAVFCLKKKKRNTQTASIALNKNRAASTRTPLSRV